MAITKEQIFDVADQLATAGQSPTLAAVRKALGGGSFTTISEAMNEWKAAHQVASVPLREPAPQAIADRLAELGVDVWAIALELANARLKADREALENTHAEMETQKAEAVELADQMATEIEQLKARCGELEAMARAEREGAEQLRQQLSSITERAKAAEVRAGELEARATDLNKELERVHADLNAERQRAAADRAKAEKIEQQQQAELARLQAENSRMEQQLKDQKQSSTEVIGRLEASKQRMEAERDEARKEAQLKAVENSRLIGELEALKSQVKEQTAIIKGMAPVGRKKPAKKTE
jgi:colicin import membrane protein